MYPFILVIDKDVIVIGINFSGFLHRDRGNYVYTVSEFLQTHGEGSCHQIVFIKVVVILLAGDNCEHQDEATNWVDPILHSMFIYCKRLYEKDTGKMVTLRKNW